MPGQQGLVEHHEILTSIDRLFEKLNGLLLARKAAARLVVKPAQLLQDLGVVLVALEHALVGHFRRFVLWLVRP